MSAPLQLADECAQVAVQGHLEDGPPPSQLPGKMQLAEELCLAGLSSQGSWDSVEFGFVAQLYQTVVTKLYRRVIVVQCNLDCCLPLSHLPDQLCPEPDETGHLVEELCLAAFCSEKLVTVIQFGGWCSLPGYMRNEKFVGKLKSIIWDSSDAVASVLVACRGF